MKRFFESNYGLIFILLKLDLSEESLHCDVCAYPFQNMDVALRKPELSIRCSSSKNGIEHLFNQIVKFFFQYGLLEEYFSSITYDIQGDMVFSNSAVNKNITHEYFEASLNAVKKQILDETENKKKCLIV